MKKTFESESEKNKFLTIEAENQERVEKIKKEIEVNNQDSYKEINTESENKKP